MLLSLMVVRLTQRGNFSIRTMVRKAGQDVVRVTGVSRVGHRQRVHLLIPRRRETFGTLSCLEGQSELCVGSIAG